MKPKIDKEFALAHKRLHERLLAYWQELRGNRAFPKEHDINPDDLEDVWDSCFLLQVIGKGADMRFRYSYLGSALIEAYGNDLTDQDVCATLIDPTTPNMIKKSAEVVKQRVQMVDESEFVNSLGMRIKYRSCLLPLGEKPNEVNYILGAMRWKAC